MKPIYILDGYFLRPVSLSDTPDIFNSINTQREHLGKWLPFVATTHRVEQTEEVVNSMLSDPGNPVYTILAGNTFAGLIGFKAANQLDRSIEIGYWLRKEHQGHGVMTHAVKTLCGIAFDNMNMQSVIIRCATGNLHSNNIPVRLGFRLDGVEINAEKMSDGTFVDLNVYILEK